MQLFDYAVGNPPYQKDEKRGSSRVTREIYQQFQKLSTTISERTTLIYPATWTRDLNSTYSKSILTSKNLEKIDEYVDGTRIFPNIKTPITIVTINKDYNKSTFTINGVQTNKNIKNWASGIKPMILHKAVQKHKKISLLNLNIKENNTMDGKLDYLSEKEFKNLCSSGEASPEDYIKINIKEKAGKQADSKDYYTLRNNFNEKYPQVPIDDYKVSIRSRLYGRQAMFMEMVFHRGEGNGLQCRIFEPNYTHGSTWTILKTFKTLEEAQNFTNYINSPIIAYLASLDYSRKTFGDFIPDLQEWSNKNPIFTPKELLPNEHEWRELDLNQRLCIYFKVNPEDAKIILKDNKYY